MKLAIFVRAPKIWGAERSLLTLLSSAAARKHEIVVFVNSDSPLVDELKERDIAFLEHSFVQHKSLNAGGLSQGSVRMIAGDIFRVARAAINLSRIVRNFDAAITFGLWETAEVALGSRLARVPCVFDFHVTFGGLRGQLALRGLLWLVNGTIAPSLATYSQAGISTLGKKERVVPRPISSPKASVSIARAPHNRLRIGIFGQIDSRKGILEVVRVLSPLSTSIELWIVGALPPSEASPYENEVVAEVEKIGCGWQVKKRVEDIYSCISQCDIVLNTSSHEAFGRTVVEASYVGALPVVIKGAGPQEIVESTGIGVVVEDLPALADLMREQAILFERGEFEGVSEVDIRRLQKQFSPETIGQQYFAFVEESLT